MENSFQCGFFFPFFFFIKRNWVNLAQGLGKTRVFSYIIAGGMRSALLGSTWGERLESSVWFPAPRACCGLDVRVAPEFRC